MVKYDSSFFKGKNVLITGDSGFKGSWLALLLWKLGANVSGYSLPPYTENDHYVVTNLSEKINHIDGDLANIKHLLEVFQDKKPEIVFHLAAQPLVRLSYSDPVNTFATNVQGSVNVLDCVRCTNSVRSLIFVTSDKCYKNKEWIWGYRESDELGGHDPYSASKAASEIIFESYRLSFFANIPNLGVASVRAGNVIGGGDWSADRIIPDCIRSLSNNEEIEIRNPKATRPWQHVLEPVYGYMQLAAALWEEPANYTGAWNFGPDQGSHKNVEKLVETVIKNWGTGSFYINTKSEAPHEAGFLHLNCDKVHNYLGWSSVWDFQKTIGETVNWYKSVDKEKESLRQIKDFLTAKENKNDSGS